MPLAMRFDADLGGPDIADKEEPHTGLMCGSWNFAASYFALVVAAVAA